MTAHQALLRVHLDRTGTALLLASPLRTAMVGGVVVLTVLGQGGADT